MLHLYINGGYSDLRWLQTISSWPLWPSVNNDSIHFAGSYSAAGKTKPSSLSPTPCTLEKHKKALRKRITLCDIKYSQRIKEPTYKRTKQTIPHSLTLPISMLAISLCQLRTLKVKRGHMKDKPKVSTLINENIKRDRQESLCHSANTTTLLLD